jgi:myo-inositol-1(or 4)-monophosphatase
LKDADLTDANPMQIRLLAAQAIAREAGRLARQRFLDASFSVKFKGPQDYLTEVDSETEDLIASRLHEAFPGDGFIGEETQARRAETGAAVWVVDPIDGTSNFARGIAHFCVSIACVANGKIEVGVIYDPMRDELFSARRGGGARLNGLAIKPSEASALANASVEVGWNVRAGAARYLELLRRVTLWGAAPSRSGSGALGIAYVAAGRRDGYVEQHIHAWDCLAAVLLVNEAGGYVSDFLAGDGLNKGNPLIASAPAMKDALVSAVDIEGIVL